MDETRNPQQPSGEQPQTPEQAPAVPQPEQAAAYEQAPVPEQVPAPPAEPANPFARPDAPADTSSFGYPPPAAEPAYQQQAYNPDAAYQRPEAQYPQQPYQGGSGYNPYGYATGALPPIPGTLPYQPGPPQPKPRRGLAAGVAVGAIALALIAGVTGSVATVALSDDGPNGSAPVITREVSPTSNKTTPAGTVEAAAATINPSVVTLQVAGSEGGRTSQGTGSGVVIREDGYILTNNHVVAPAASGGTVRVFFSDGTEKDATIVGRDPSNDLAVVKVENSKGLKAATFAESATLKIGQPVVAVGAPLGLSGTVTQGIVSAVDRPVRTGDGTGQDAVIDAVQTDAAINPGNSGGPLVDLSGRVIGINSAIATVGGGQGGLPGQSSQSGNIGVGFAIPSDDAVKIAKQLIEKGKASHATLGVTAQDSSDGTGASVVSVVPGSAADKAKLRVNDVITAIGDRRVVNVDSLVAAVRDHESGGKVTVTYERGGKATKVDVTLGNS